MKTYEVHARYFRPSGGQVDVTMNVDADSPPAAIYVAKKSLTANCQRSIKEWGKFDVKPLCATPEPEPKFLLGGTYALNNGTMARVVTTYKDGRNHDRVVIENPANGANTIVTFEEWLRLATPKHEYVYYSMYPNGGIYQQEHGPVKTSHVAMDQLVQVKITKLNGKVVKKEFV